jgi:hypothetical protein
MWYWYAYFSKSKPLHCEWALQRKFWLQGCASTTHVAFPEHIPCADVKLFHHWIINRQMKQRLINHSICAFLELQLVRWLSSTANFWKGTAIQFFCSPNNQRKLPIVARFLGEEGTQKPLPGLLWWFYSLFQWALDQILHDTLVGELL